VGGTVGTVGIPVGDGVTGSTVGAAVFVGAPVVGDLVGGQVDVGLGAWDGGGVVGSGVTYQDHGSTESMNCREYSPSVLPIAEAISFTSFLHGWGFAAGYGKCVGMVPRCQNPVSRTCRRAH